MSATPSTVLDNTSPAWRRCWHAVATSAEVGAEPVGIHLLGDAWVLARLDGEVVAFEDRCPHRLAPLSAGRVIGDALQCGYHGWEFVASGRCVAMPPVGAVRGDKISSRADVRGPFGVQERYGLVWLAPDEPVTPLHEFPEWDAGGDGGFDRIRSTIVETPVSAAQLVDNFLDASHFPYVHRDTFGDDKAALVVDDGIERDGWVVRTVFETWYRNFDDPLVATGEHEAVQPQRLLKQGDAGLTVHLRLEFPVTGATFAILFCCQPQTGGSTRIFKLMARNDLAGDTERIARCIRDEDQILAEDLAILERYARMEIHLDPRVEVHTKADRLSLAWRRVLGELVGLDTEIAELDEGTPPPAPAPTAVDAHRGGAGMTAITTTEPGVFGVDDLDGLDAFHRANGFVILRGLFDADLLARMETECVEAQRQVTDGELADRYGTSILIEGDAGTKAEVFTNYVTHVNELSPAVREAATHPVLVSLMQRWLGSECWLLDDIRFGVVYQDARAGRESSYSRIGWHSDWQSGPNLAMWPSTAFTFHLDATSPANGFLRVVPGSHRWATPAPYRNVNGAVVPEGSDPWGGYTDEPPPIEMPLGFDKVPGEIAVYAEVGDIIFHDAYTWHSAARATDDATTRRHVRGGWYSGQGKLTGEHLADFVKNAAR